MPTHLLKKSRKNTRFIRHFEYNDIQVTTKKQIESKLKPSYPKWYNAMQKFPPSALLAIAPSHYIEKYHPSTFPFQIQYPTPTGKRKKDQFKSKMIPPPLEFQDGLDFKLSVDYPYELAKPQFLSNTEEELKKNESLDATFNKIRKEQGISEAYKQVTKLFEENQMKKCDTLYSLFDKLELSSYKDLQSLEASIKNDSEDATPLTVDEKLKIKLLLMMKQKYDQLNPKEEVDAKSDPFLEIQQSKPTTYRVLHLEKKVLELSRLQRK